MDYREYSAFCINLDTRPDRWEQAQHEFTRVDWAITRWPASPPSARPLLSPGAAGCLESHRRVWRHCLEQQLPAVFVFEDDAVLAPRFKDIFGPIAAQLPENWEIWHLHSAHARVQAVSADLVAYLGSGWGSHGYAIRASACEKLLAHELTQPVDVQLTGAYLQLGGAPLGTAMRTALCLQRGDDTDIPINAQIAYWRQLRAQTFRNE